MPKAEPNQLALLLDSTAELPPNRHRYQFTGQAIDYTLNRGGRRRSITLTIDERGLRVGAPAGASQRRIESVLAAHAPWIARKLAEWAARRPAAFEWGAGARIMVLGNPLILSPVAASSTITRTNDLLQYPATLDSPALAKTIMEWLRATALNRFEQRVAHYSPILKVNMPAIKLSNARTRWGTCHPHGRVHLNWRLIHMPPALIDYVVVHELAHLHEPNHSPRFWRRVATVLPDHLEQRRILRCDAHRYLLP